MELARIGAAEKKLSLPSTPQSPMPATRATPRRAPRPMATPARGVAASGDPVGASHADRARHAARVATRRWRGRPARRGEEVAARAARHRGGDRRSRSPPGRSIGAGAPEPAPPHRRRRRRRQRRAGAGAPASSGAAPPAALRRLRRRRRRAAPHRSDGSHRASRRSRSRRSSPSSRSARDPASARAAARRRGTRAARARRPLDDERSARRERLGGRSPRGDRRGAGDHHRDARRTQHRPPGVGRPGAGAGTGHRAGRFDRDRAGGAQSRAERHRPAARHRARRVRATRSPTGRSSGGARTRTWRTSRPMVS